MSPLFVKSFLKSVKCPQCKNDKLAGYSLCQEHLITAKVQWRFWSKKRRDEGKCCYCDCKSLNGWLRCRKHTKINREVCRKWMAVHGKDKYNEMKDSGVCTRSCGRPATPGHTMCQKCLDKLKAYHSRSHH